MKDRARGLASEVNVHKHLLFVVSEDWYFVSHRLDLAKLAIDKGWKVTVACQVSAYKEEISSAGIEIAPWKMPRGSMNPVLLFKAIIELRSIVKKSRASTVHAVSIMTVVIARVAIARAQPITFIGTVAGLGAVKPKNSFVEKISSSLIPLIGRWLTWTRGASIVAQNREDFKILGGPGNTKVHLIPGSGINPAKFPPSPAIQRPRTIVVLIARMIREKGILEFIAAINSLHSRGLSVSGLLIGEPDPKNNSSLTVEELYSLTANGAVDWLGHRTDVASQIASSDIVCLPSYSEGIPRTVLEAGCVGRAVIACDVPGLRDVIRQGIDGILVPPRDSNLLAGAIMHLATQPQIRDEMARSLRDRVMREFTNDSVLAPYFELYDYEKITLKPNQAQSILGGYPLRLKPHDFGMD